MFIMYCEVPITLYYFLCTLHHAKLPACNLFGGGSCRIEALGISARRLRLLPAARQLRAGSELTTLTRDGYTVYLIYSTQ